MAPLRAHKSVRHNLTRVAARKSLGHSPKASTNFASSSAALKEQDSIMWNPAVFEAPEPILSFSSTDASAPTPQSSPKSVSASASTTLTPSSSTPDSDAPVYEPFFMKRTPSMLEFYEKMKDWDSKGLDFDGELPTKTQMDLDACLVAWHNHLESGVVLPRRKQRRSRMKKKSGKDESEAESDAFSAEDYSQWIRGLKEDKQNDLTFEISDY